jgi:hypothetical protein
VGSFSDFLPTSICIWVDFSIFDPYQIPYG